MSGPLKYKSYLASVDFDAEDEIFVGRITGINDIVSFHAESVAELKQAFKDSVENYLDTCKELGKEPERTYSGNLMLRIDPTVHSKVAQAAEIAGKSLNQWSEDVLRKASGAQ